MTETVKVSVEGVCLKIYHLSAEHARKVKDKHSALLKEQGIEELSAPIQQSALRKVWCYPIQFAIPATRMPIVDYMPDNRSPDHTLVTYHKDTVAINTTHLTKLVNK